MSVIRSNGKTLLVSLLSGLCLPALLLLCSGCTTPSTSTAPADPWFYVVAADPQMFWKQKDASNWRKTIDHLNRLKPDFVIVCGDMLNLQNNPGKWPKPDAMGPYDKLAETYHQIASGLDNAIPIHHVAGNHDVSTRPTEETLAWYESKFGKPWYAFEHKNSFFLVLQSDLIRDPSGAEAKEKAQWAWLEETLKQAGEKGYDHKTVYMHHPLFTASVEEKNSYFNIQKPARKKLLSLFRDHGFRAAFSGHMHRNAQAKDGDLEIVVTSSCGASLGKDPVGFRIVKVYPDRLEHQYYGFADMPEQVKLND